MTSTYRNAVPNLALPMPGYSKIDDELFAKLMRQRPIVRASAT
jgi:hypothetical protein